jgi:hypothetical protein
MGKGWAKGEWLRMGKRGEGRVKVEKRVGKGKWHKGGKRWKGKDGEYAMGGKKGKG